MQCESMPRFISTDTAPMILHVSKMLGDTASPRTTPT
jgi:hypothetical protein